jgi:hypothetical protein
MWHLPITVTSRPIVALLAIRTSSIREATEARWQDRVIARRCDDAFDLVRSTASVECAVAVYEITGHEPQGATAALHALRRRLPGVPLLLLTALDGHTPEYATAFAQAVGTELVVRPDTEHLARALDDLLVCADSQSIAGRIHAITQRAPACDDRVVNAFIMGAAHAPRAVTTVGVLTTCLGLPARTLRRHLHDAGLPTTHVIFWTVMVVRAASLLRDPRCTLERVTALLPFSTVSEVTNRFRRYAGISPRDARDRNAVGMLLAHFEALICHSAPGATTSRSRRLGTAQVLGETTVMRP